MSNLGFNGDVSYGISSCCFRESVQKAVCVVWVPCAREVHINTVSYLCPKFRFRDVASLERGG